MSTASSFSRSPTPPGRPTSDARSVMADLDNIFRLNSSQQTKPQPVPGGAPERRRITQADLDAAVNMLSEAGKAMDIMQTRYHQVENYARDVADRADRDLTAAYGQAKDFESRALAAESKLDEMNARVVDAERRMELAERRAHAADLRVDHAERSAKEAREWLEAFYEKIVASFDARPTVKSAA